MAATVSKFNIDQAARQAANGLAKLISTYPFVIVWNFSYVSVLTDSEGQYVSSATTLPSYQLYVSSATTLPSYQLYVSSATTLPSYQLYVSSATRAGKIRITPPYT
ncbi:hypothetical protein LSAT2_002180 [Lamellibrachia satsuma]|nr:hypothetical protein LSAT2_002180 [Lamellibrachia satsuma]